MKKVKPCYQDWEDYACCIECAMCEKEDCHWCQEDREKAIKEAGSYKTEKWAKKLGEKAKYYYDDKINPYD